MESDTHHVDAGDVVQIGSQRCWIFERDGRLHVHDADTGERLYIRDYRGADEDDLRELLMRWRGSGEPADECCADELEDLLNSEESGGDIVFSASRTNSEGHD